MKTPDQHLRLLALPAALAFALVGCDKGSGSEKAAAKPESSATAKAAGSADEATSAAAPVAAPAVADNGFSAVVAQPNASNGSNASSAGTQANAKNAARTGGAKAKDSKPGNSALTTSTDARTLQGPTRPNAADQALDITLVPDKLELGQMQPGVPKTGIVKLTNNGTNSVQIKKAVASCGCTTPSWPREPIGPGETAEIEITLKPSLKQGQRLNKRVTLQMVAGPPQVITVAGEVGIFIEMGPDFLDAAKQDDPSQKALVLTSADEVPFSVVKVDPPVLTTGVGGEKALSHEMEIDWAAWEEAGRRPLIKLTTDHPNAPELSVTVRRAIVRDKPLPPPRMIDRIPMNKVVASAQAQDAKGVAAAIAAQEDVNGASQGGMTALHWAAKEGNAEILGMLIAANADINKTNKVGKTPVAMAAESGNLEVLKTLVAKGGKINTVDEIGGTPLLWAAALSKNPATVSYLLENGADVNVIDSNGMTPLIWAAGIGQPGSVQVLLDNGADLGIVEKHQKENALMRAARIGNPESLVVLISAKPDLEAKNLLGQTALLIAASSAPPEKIELLVNAGADLQTRDTRQWSVLDHAQARTDQNRAAVIAYFQEKMSEGG
ncbi:MAG: hypothetical protein CMJ67_07970 [Planctomycetaceae bacterium]|nr:hypothetical protein [Planctomycetaceae bacterium]